HLAPAERPPALDAAPERRPPRAVPTRDRARRDAARGREPAAGVERRTGAFVEHAERLDLVVDAGERAVGRDPARSAPVAGRACAEREDERGEQQERRSHADRRAGAGGAAAGPRIPGLTSPFCQATFARVPCVSPGSCPRRVARAASPYPSGLRRRLTL